jgi:hypothetical protein
VTVCKAVPEIKTEQFTVMVARKIPYQAKRLVCVSLPHTETVTLTRLVPRTVEKLVPVESCYQPCCQPCCCPKSRRCCR